MMNTELDDRVYEVIVSYCEKGNVFFEQGDYQEAFDEYMKAFEWIPQPIKKWEASTWILVALGDCAFLLGNYKTAHQFLSMSMHCPDALGTPFIHLRLGQVQLELGNKERAKDELMRAYMGEGEEIFEGEEIKYFNFIKEYL